MEERNVVYIIDICQKYTKDKVIDCFFINNNWYAIKEVELKWGIPQLSSLEEMTESPHFKLYNTIEDARKYVRQLKRLEGMKF